MHTACSHTLSDALLSSESLGSQREMIKRFFFFSFQLKDTALFALPLEYDFSAFCLFSVSAREMSVLTRITDC